MPGTKRKASFAFPYERPSKLNKRTSSTTVSKTLSSMTKRVSVPKPPLTMPRFPTLTATSELASEETSSAAASAPTPPALRRASTLTLEDESKGDSTKSSPLTKRKSSATSSKPTSLTKKSSSFVEAGALVTKLSGLKSGSIVGETSLSPSVSLTKDSSLPKALSRKSSKVPSLPSGLTKLALPGGESKTGSLRISKSKLVSDIDETELDLALTSLKTSLTKTGSTKRSSLSKSASLKSRSSSAKADEKVPDNVDDITKDKSEDMDTSTSSAADDSDVVSGPSGDGLIEIVISFDTTGSMYGCLAEVKAKVQDLVQRLQSDIPGIRVAIIAHGDYCDESNYVIKWIDFGAALPEICNFVQTVGRTGGGDGPECYELVLQRSREVLSWTPGSKRLLVMIGDNLPHEPGYTCNGKTYHINWRDECAALKAMGVKIYAVQAGGYTFATAINDFNEEMARITGGKRLTLSNFGCLFDILMMICYREGNPEMLAVYEQEIIDRGERMADDITSLKKTFDMPSAAKASSSAAFTPILGKGAGIKFGKAGIMGLAKAKKTVDKKVGAKALPKATAKKAVAKALPKATAKKAVAKAAVTKKNAKIGKTKQTTKPRKVKTVKLREKLPDSCMVSGHLKNFTWSKWTCAVVPEMPKNKSKTNFIKLPKYSGYGPKTIFDDNFRVSAIYEMAVQICRKKYAVYFRMSMNGFTRRGHWSINLLRHKKVRLEVNNVLKQGGSVYIRRGLPSAKIVKKRRAQMFAANKFIRDNYDYAWKKYIWRRSEADGDKSTKFGLKHRNLVVKRKGKTFTLSDGTI